MGYVLYIWYASLCRVPQLRSSVIIIILQIAKAGTDGIRGSSKDPTFTTNSYWRSLSLTCIAMLGRDVVATRLLVVAAGCSTIVAQESHVAILTPHGAPAVAYQPIPCATAVPVAHHIYSMVDVRVGLVAIVENATLVHTP